MLACVTVFFNPCKYKTNLKNYFTFREHFPKSIPLYVIEASYDGNFETDASFQIKANPNNQIMWQKERLINKVVDWLPSRFTRYMYSDCDLLFPEGWDKLALGSTDIVQGYGEIDFLGVDGKIIQTKLSAMNRTINGGDYGCPGGVWIYPREVRQYERAPAGAGDSLLERALIKKSETWPKEILAPKEYAYYQHWSQLIDSLPYKVGFIDKKIQHLWHGDRENRQYLTRHLILKENDFDPIRDIQIAKNGLLSWCSHKPDMHRRIKEYFVNRKEDLC